MQWVNFLHFYQPPFQNSEVIDQVIRESYLWFTEVMLDHPEARMTINISGSLIEHLSQKKDGRKTLDRFKKLFQRNQIEIVGSAMYHPILPLIPEHQAMRQISINTDWLQKIFGKRFRPKGFFLPEMAYAPKIAKLLDDMDFTWVILDEISFNGSLNPTNLIQGANIRGTNLKALFRNRRFSNTHPPKSVLDEQVISSHDHVITATDGELYGHHHQDSEKHLIKALQHPNIQTLTCSDLLTAYDPKKSLSPLSCSWESTERELKNNNPFALWNDPKNQTHQQLWRLIKYIAGFLESHAKDENIDWARHHFDRGLSSCTQWWMSGSKVGAWDMVSWNPDEIGKGVDELMRAMRSINNLSLEERLKAEKMYIQIKYDIWEKHWKNYWKHNTQ